MTPHQTAVNHRVVTAEAERLEAAGIRVTQTDRRLTASEAHGHGLPSGGCCCQEHGHTWYERTQGVHAWLECNHCAEWRGLA